MEYTNKKIILIFTILLSSYTNANADIYHGIDIDAVYNSSDWSSKSKIREIIDDYTLTLHYKNKLNQCTKNIVCCSHLFVKLKFFKKSQTNLSYILYSISYFPFRF